MRKSQPVIVEIRTENREEGVKRLAAAYCNIVRQHEETTGTLRGKNSYNGTETR